MFNKVARGQGPPFSSTTSVLPIYRKLDILAASAKYDVSCSSSGVKEGDAYKGSFGSTTPAGICHSWTSDGRCVSLLKVLLTNFCVYDCAYCINRRSNDIRRASFTPKEISGLTINFYKRNYIEGLFLSSGIIKNPDYTMELLIRSVEILRKQQGFGGYVHLKIIPGADPVLIKKAGLLADRVSVNIELPSNKSLNLLCPDKSKDAILKPMGQVAYELKCAKEEGTKSRHYPPFASAGQSTQLIIGATPESDLHIMTLSESLYRKMQLKRVYYSAYVAVNNDRRLPSNAKPMLLREHRLYQGDWLLRFYGFKPHELLNDETPFFDAALDPKASWALRNLHMFPVEINTADYSVLLKVPGVGVKSADKILRARKLTRLKADDLKKLGIVLKRAKYFITADGKYYGKTIITEEKIRKKLVDECISKYSEPEQLRLPFAQSVRC
ncbi:MAG: putative DNA modification/repair radical SAM protein [Candidatus Magnetoovum sp. WYHC-5]|nr:putative DNA modification/repair radical SAM protein [Candidatus Magnetoovum sp. WYHC-5]